MSEARCQGTDPIENTRENPVRSGLRRQGKEHACPAGLTRQITSAANAASVCLPIGASRTRIPGSLMPEAVSNRGLHYSGVEAKSHSKEALGHQSFPVSIGRQEFYSIHAKIIYYHHKAYLWVRQLCNGKIPDYWQTNRT